VAREHRHPLKSIHAFVEDLWIFGFSEGRVDHKLL
jgi:hypothetical protein